jgi:hypothetical protein
VASILFKFGLSAFRQVFLPRSFKLEPRPLERLCRAFDVPPTMVGGRVKAALPSPLIDVDGNAGTDRDCADMHIAAIDVPAWLAGVRIAVAGEDGHTLLKRGGDLIGKPLGVADRNQTNAINSRSCSVVRNPLPHEDLERRGDERGRGLQVRALFAFL